MDIVTLSGTWLLLVGGPAPALPQADLPAVVCTSSIDLPGTLETRERSPLNPVDTPQHLGRVRKYDGPAWYSREVVIPDSAAGKWGELFLERTKFAQAWWDDKPLGTSERYLSPAEFPLPDPLRPGTHRLTVLVDNSESLRPVRSEAHQFSDNTQTNWNGLLGRLELRISEAVAMREASVYPLSGDTAFSVRIPVSNRTGAPAQVRLAVAAESFNHPGEAHRPAAVTVESTVEPGTHVLTAKLPLGPGVRPWDEFSPALYRVRIALDAPGGKSEQAVDTGFRTFSSNGSHFTINGRPTFLRGKHDGCVFPLTGHPPMDVEGWIKYLQTCREWGINHVRCHTWVPPKAAFEAADRLGIYLQPELPFWGYVNPQVQAWMREASREILATYASHPSFVMMTLGNEIDGDRSLLNAVVSELRQLDATRLFADGSNNVLWKPEVQPSNQFMASAKIVRPDTGALLPIRGSFCYADDRDRTFGLVQWQGDNTRYDFEQAVQNLPYPVVSHEIGQYSIFPDFAEIAKYTGVTRANNLAFFKRRVEASGLGGLAQAFHNASGVLAADLYREEIEAALRTPSFGGFQLLDLQDFPGQGTALVGVLDAFMDPKGVITSEQWRSFCAPTVPLARFDKFIWVSNETFRADLELSHFGANDLAQVRCDWELRDKTGARIAVDTLQLGNIATGGLRSLGHMEVLLPVVTSPRELELSVSIRSGAFATRQQWNLWLYPNSGDTQIPVGVTLSRSLDAKTLATLTDGGRVLLMPERGNWGETLGGAYATDFWNWRMFNNPPGTMGLLIDSAHPALAGFPSATHSDRRWSAIATAATPLLLGADDANFTVPVRVIDNFERNEPLGLLFETRVGQGRLLVSAVDLLGMNSRPEAAALLRSLLNYCASDLFSPTRSLDPTALKKRFAPSLTRNCPVEVSSAHAVAWEPLSTPAGLCDGDLNSKWLAKEGDATPWAKVTLAEAATLSHVTLVWEGDQGCSYVVETSRDGSTWETAAEVTKAQFAKARHELEFAPREARHVRVRVVELSDSKRTALRELRVPAPI
ncbi:discoidin domain-containing protein [Nibricoccus sp. IMCC34717]|uniref:discoidin domain-containing protein n=1 Tax=Nibricoccus sp. IMCC34717 TaxID=3034021 RepID=UPI00384E3F44